MSGDKVTALLDGLAHLSAKMDTFADAAERWGLAKWTQMFHAEANRVGVDVSKVAAAALQEHHAAGLSVREALGKYESKKDGVSQRMEMKTFTVECRDKAARGGTVVMKVEAESAKEASKILRGQGFEPVSFRE